MDFVLSKFLPVFLYPLGLACLLLVAAAIALVRQGRGSRRVALACIGSALVLLWLPGTPAFSTSLLRGLERQYLPRSLPEADAIVVLGGGTKPWLPPRPWVEVSEAGDRVLYAAKLYREGKAPWLILSGGRAPWLGDGGRISEAAEMAAIATFAGVPASAILQEPNSLNTYENGLYVRHILRSRRLRRVLLVTSAWHMPRAMAVFRHLGMEAIAAPTDFFTTEDAGTKGAIGTIYDLLPHAEALRNSSGAIKEYVGAIAYKLLGRA